MKFVLSTVATLGVLAGVANASPEPRCWYGVNAPACRDFQRTEATNTGGLKGEKASANSEREFDHERETTRPY